MSEPSTKLRLEENKVLLERNDTIIEILNFILDSELTLTYKKVFLKVYIQKYSTEENKEEIKNIILNKDKGIYNYLFLSQYDKLKNKPEKLKSINEAKKKYYYKNKKEISDKRKQVYHENKELINLKEENEKLKLLLKNQDEDNK